MDKLNIETEIIGLKLQAKKLYEDAKKLRVKTQALERQRKEAVANLIRFEAQFKEFEKYFAEVKTE